MEQTECSETSAHKIQTPGNYPEENIQQGLDMFYVLICIIATTDSLASCLIRFPSLHTFSVHFSAFFLMQYPKCNILAVRTRKCRLLQRHFRDVAPTSARITDITLSRMTLAPASIHGYNAVADDLPRQPSSVGWLLSRQPSSVGWLLRRQPSSILESALARDKEGQKCREGETFWVHTYPTVCSRPWRRYVPSLVQIGSEIWICMRYKLTNTHTNKT
jgi:hypothetical protein